MIVNKIFLLICLLISTQGIAQLSTSFSFSGLSLESSNTASFTEPLIISSSGTCIFVSNGISKFETSTYRNFLFIDDCNSLENNLVNNFIVYPNPAYGYTKLFSTKALSGSDRISFSFLDAKGSVLQSREVNSRQLISGVAIETQKFASGIYFIKIFSKGVASTIKLLILKN